MKTGTMKETKIVALAAALFLAVLVRAANVPASGVDLKPNIVVNAEDSYVKASIGILENELLNNEEEEFILLAPDDSYFTGFNDGMTDLIAQLNAFNYSGVEATDLAAIGSNLLAAQNAADALGTTYGTGEGTAYQYALVVLNRKSFRNTLTAATPVKVDAQAGSQDSKVPSPIGRPASELVRPGGNGESL